MFCPNCGLEVADGTEFCPSCSQRLIFSDNRTISDNSFTEVSNDNFTDNSSFSDLEKQNQTENQSEAQEFGNAVFQNPVSNTQPEGVETQKPIPNFLVWSILCTIFCCLPCGIVGIVYSNNVENFIVQKRFEEAKKASDKAKIWNLVGTILGVISAIFVIVYYVYLLLCGNHTMRY